MSASDPMFAKFGKSHPAGSVLFKEDDSGSTMFVVRSGTVAITRQMKGTDKTLAVLGPGEFFGEMAILNSKPRSATATVKDAADILELDATTFEQMLTGNAEIAVRLIKRMAKRLAQTDELIEVLMHRDARGRVILGLAHEAEIVGVPNEDGSVDLPLSMADFSKQIGLSQEEVEGVFRRLSRLGIASRADAGLRVADLGKLEEFYNFLQLQQTYGES